MKKSLLALAALSAFATAAQAQSSVSVYGVLDVNYQSIDNSTENSTIQGAGGLTTSRLGFRGTEDLGGGTKAEFQLEAKLTPGTGVLGATNAKTFNRESWVGLSDNKLGSVRVGLMDLTDVANIDANTSQAGNLGLITGLNGNDISQAIRYTTPTFGGFSAQVGYANPGASATNAEGTIAAATSSVVNSYYAQYVAGPASLYAGMESKKISTTYNQEQTVLGAKYNFGFATVGLTHSTADGSTESTKSTDEVKSTRLSVSAPVAALGKGITAHVVYFKDTTGDGSSALGTNSAETAPVALNENDGYTLALTKAFSPRTTAYVFYKDQDYKLTSVADTKTLGVGIRHSF
jgi:GBP family porin